MRSPIAIAIQSAKRADAYRVSIDQNLGAKLLRADAKGPAVVVVRNVSLIPNISAGLIDAEDVLSSLDGDWSDAILVVCDEAPTSRVEPPTKRIGDENFLAHVSNEAPALLSLARSTLDQVRAKGVEGDLAEAGGGRWVNRPINTFTLKVQPRARNLHFTLYGNPQTYSAGEFLLQDQNSYSRGWVRDQHDATQFATLASESHARRRK